MSHFARSSPRTAMSTAHSTWLGVGWRAWALTSLRETEHQRSVSMGVVETAAARAAAFFPPPVARAGEG
ncbi:hypothetical protein, partial [Streptomyces sp. SPB074]|uniref:hypothetical protein n=1 Tax=Streptomyces sp. (strain SPB074) TaxID=465543 RepID=UPI002D21BB8D